MTATLAVPRSDIAGVSWNAERQCWLARKYFVGGTHFLGRHETLEAAKAALDAWEPSSGELERAATPKSRRPMNPASYASQPLHADGYPTLGRTRMTDEQVAYALSIAHEIRGF